MAETKVLKHQMILKAKQATMQTSDLARTLTWKTQLSTCLWLGHKSTQIRLKLLHAQTHAHLGWQRVGQRGNGGGKGRQKGGASNLTATGKHERKNMKRALPAKDIDYATGLPYWLPPLFTVPRPLERPTLRIKLFQSYFSTFCWAHIHTHPQTQTEIKPYQRHAPRRLEQLSWQADFFLARLLNHSTCWLDSSGIISY